LPDKTPSPYAILHLPYDAKTALPNTCALAIMCKAPRPGKVKTRLAPPLTLDQSAALNICFLRDTAANIATVPGAQGILCYTPVGDEAAFTGIAPDSFQMIPQRGDTFDQRLFFALEDLLQVGFQSVCLIDSDSPTIPHIALQTAVEELGKPGDRIVLGGSDDGGYYLIGLKAAHKEPFENITWSTASVLEETRQRCAEANIPLVELPLWYDVDDGNTLRTLAAELLENQRPPFATTNGYNATETRNYLQQLAGTNNPPWATKE
jgi:uncharacterized protein